MEQKKERLKSETSKIEKRSKINKNVQISENHKIRTSKRELRPKLGKNCSQLESQTKSWEQKDQEQKVI